MFENNVLHYSGLALDRREQLRKNPDELFAQLANGKARVIPFWNGHHWIADRITTGPDLLSITHSNVYEQDHAVTAFLGIHRSIPFFGVDISYYSQAESLSFTGGGRFVELRTTGELKHSSLAPLLAYTRALMIWHAGNRFCSKCGSATKSAQMGHTRVCSRCNHTVYPRTDSAVIVLVEYRPENGEPLCLLGRHRDRKDKMYSTFAGFVEVGERLEETVRREMLEETGLMVDNIRYIASQPWPFPSSLMLGFYAQASSMDFELDQQEVSEARWFTPSQIADLVKKDQLILSREDSIARYLIQRWVNENLTVGLS